MEPYKENIQFVAKQYRKGRFKTDDAWHRLGFVRYVFGWRAKVAAAVAAVVVLSATATFIVRYHDTEPVPAEQPAAVNVNKVVRIIDFEDAPLPEVIARIKEVYGVEVVNVPDNASDYRLSLHYEGNVVNLVSTINDILGTKLLVK